jgi:hypothetical protein
MVVIVVMMTGCASTSGGKLSYNMTQSVSRSGGDVAMTALLDEGVDAKKAREYVAALVQLIEKGDLDKVALRQACLDTAAKLKLTGVADYIDALMVVVPGKIGEYEKIPVEYREALVSFLRDGATRALDLYKADKKPKPDGS